MIEMKEILVTFYSLPIPLMWNCVVTGTSAPSGVNKQSYYTWQYNQYILAEGISVVVPGKIPMMEIKHFHTVKSIICSFVHLSAYSCC